MPHHHRRHVWLTICLLAFAALPARAQLKFEQFPGYRVAPLSVPAAGRTGFSLLPPQVTGILFTNVLNEFRSITNRNLLGGSGLAAADVDGDDWCDLYFCSLDGNNALYRNLGGWKFEDITARAGVACPNLDATGAVFADVDGDGDQDLLVSSLGGGVRLFLNDGHGVFTDATHASGLASRSGATSMALADLDGDGDLDLYVVNYRPSTIMDRPQTKFQVQIQSGRPVVVGVNGAPATHPEWTNRFVVAPSGRVLELGEADVIYTNDGHGRFTELSFTGGGFLDEEGRPLREPPRDWGLAVQIRDMNGDGLPDIYVCNDLFTPDRIWINDGGLRFHALPPLALRNTSTFSMGVDFADLNRDGSVDFFVVDMLSRDHRLRQVQVAESTPYFAPVGVFQDRLQFARNTLQLGRGDGTFAEAAFYAGVEASEWSWGPVFLDVDLDGYEDILVSNGQWGDFQNADMADKIEAIKAAQKLSPTEVMNLVRMFPRLATPKLLFRNRGDLTFEEVGSKWGFDTKGISHGIALADLDNDGDLDLVINNLNEPAGIYRNETTAPRVAVRLRGAGGNTRGIGARIVVTGGPVRQSQEMIAGGRYLSSDDPARVFAAGTGTNQLGIEVTWRNGGRTVVNGAEANKVYEIAEAGASAPVAAAPAPKRMFREASALLNHRHVEEPFEDFERQPLLPHRLSQLGPGVAWQDVDGDGWEDLLIGSGRGGKLSLFLNQGGKSFLPSTNLALTKVTGRDLTGLIALGSTLFAGSSNYEDGLTNGGALRIYDLKRQVSGENLPGQNWGAGPLAAADFDGDGDIDLFVGGRVRAGRYPEAADSVLLANDRGRLVVAQRFERLGLVSGAVWSDLDGDGLPELIVACEWGPVRVFKRDQGVFKEVTTALGLDKLTGWWNGVVTGDFDGDGRPDILASNWGLNTKYRTSAAHPRRLYHGDFNGDGVLDLVEAAYDEGFKNWMPDRGLRPMRAALPSLAEKFQTYHDYGGATVAEFLGDQAATASFLEVNTLASTLFLNRGDRFEAIPLPAEAQLAVAFGVAVADFDGDGKEDAFLSQNFFPMNGETTRSDAGRGLLLRGDGRGGFTAVSGAESGVAIYGEQRGCAAADYDGDGRPDLVVTQNGAETVLLHNENVHPGLRVRLIGSAGNVTGIGASMRLDFGGKSGPAREIHAGAGYWSQDGPIQVMATPEAPKQVLVRWPGGRSQTNAIPAGAHEVEVSAEGALRMIR